MRDVASRSGWKLDPPDPGALVAMDPLSRVTITGEDSAVPIRLELCAGAHTFTTIAFFQPPLPVKLAITHEGLGGKIANLVGFHDVEIGDPNFDKRFRIVAKDADRTRRLLTPDVQTLLLRLDDAANSFGSRFYVGEGSVSLLRAVWDLMSAEEIMSDLPLITSLVCALKAASSATER